MIRVLYMVACTNNVFILFHGQDWQGRIFKIMKNDNSLNTFISFGLFPHVFRQVKECLILQLHEMIKVLREVAWPIVFILFNDRYWQGGVL